MEVLKEFSNVLEAPDLDVQKAVFSSLQVDMVETRGIFHTLMFLLTVRGEFVSSCLLCNSSFKTNHQPS